MEYSTEIMLVRTSKISKISESLMIGNKRLFFRIQ